MPSKQSQVIEKIFNRCKEDKNYVFCNEAVKEVCKEKRFGNPFTATKFYSIAKLPEILLENDYAIISLGSGKYKFIEGINKVYHKFEKIQEHIDWEYKKSLLNQHNTSESNILSVANNQRILHHFLFGKDTEFDDVDILMRPKTYFPHRTKTSFEYSFGENTKIVFDNIQIEIDLTIEFQGTICVFEGKNGKPDSFNVCQIYHPFLYYYNAKEDLNGENIKIICVYVVREKGKKYDTLKLWSYTFTNPLDITSIKLIKSAAYKLINIS